MAVTADALERPEDRAWDSGKLASDRSVAVTYAGKPPESHRSYCWVVRIRDKRGTVGEWSDALHDRSSLGLSHQSGAIPPISGGSRAILHLHHVSLRSTLRAAEDQAGDGIRCWDCHGPTSYRIPGRVLAWLVRSSQSPASSWISGPSSASCGGPGDRVLPGDPPRGVGPWLLRPGADRGVLSRPRPRRWPERAPCSVVPDPAMASLGCACRIWGPVIVFGFTAPVLLRHVVMDRYGLMLSWGGPGVATTAAVSWDRHPPGGAAAVSRPAPDAAGPDPGPPGAGGDLAQHPLAMTVILLLFPLGLLALEAALVAGAIVQGRFEYFVMDLFPDLASNRVVPGVGNDLARYPAALPPLLLLLEGIRPRIGARPYAARVAADITAPWPRLPGPPVVQTDLRSGIMWRYGPSSRPSS